MKKYRFQPLNEIFRLLFPATCCNCGNLLVGQEHHLCSNCLMHLPEANYSEIEHNTTEQRLSGQIPFQSATSLLRFSKGNSVQRILHEIKYNGNIDLGHLFGRRLGQSLAESHRFDDIDLLVPVPLHWLSHWRRGYNQSTVICEGIAETFSKPINSSNLYRSSYTRSQTHKNRENRMDNILNAFSVRNPKDFQNKHLLLIDDVITTGATTCACWEALKSIPGIRISIASLAITETK